jgi:hypothetical protein
MSNLKTIPNGAAIPPGVWGHYAVLTSVALPKRKFRSNSLNRHSGDNLQRAI